MQIERRATPQNAARVRTEKRKDQPTQIVGYGAVYYDGTTETEYQLWDDARERIAPGAFDRAIKEDDVRGLMNHDPNMLLGRTKAKTMRLYSDSVGLRYEIDAPDTQVGRDTLALIDRGDLDGSSFSFYITDEEWRKEDGVHIREIRGVELFDTGPVTYPAYSGTSADVHGLRAVGDAKEARASFDQWKKRQADGECESIDIAMRIAEAEAEN